MPMSIRDRYEHLIKENPEDKNLEVSIKQRVEEKANEMLKDGYELVTLTETTTAKAILVFKK